MSIKIIDKIYKDLKIEFNKNEIREEEIKLIKDMIVYTDGGDKDITGDQKVCFLFYLL
jgi:hypothetical protein